MQGNKENDVGESAPKRRSSILKARDETTKIQTRENNRRISFHNVLKVQKYNKENGDLSKEQEEQLHFTCNSDNFKTEAFSTTYVAGPTENDDSLSLTLLNSPQATSTPAVNLHQHHRWISRTTTTKTIEFDETYNVFAKIHEPPKTPLTSSMINEAPGGSRIDATFSVFDRLFDPPPTSTVSSRAPNMTYVVNAQNATTGPEMATTSDDATVNVFAAFRKPDVMAPAFASVDPTAKVFAMLVSDKDVTMTKDAESTLEPIVGATADISDDVFMADDPSFVRPECGGGTFVVSASAPISGTNNDNDAEMMDTENEANIGNQQHYQQSSQHNTSAFAENSVFFAEQNNSDNETVEALNKSNTIAECSLFAGITEQMMAQAAKFDETLRFDESILAVAAATPVVGDTNLLSRSRARRLQSQTPTALHASALYEPSELLATERIDDDCADVIAAEKVSSVVCPPPPKKDLISPTITASMATENETSVAFNASNSMAAVTTSQQPSPFSFSRKSFHQRSRSSVFLSRLSASGCMTSMPSPTANFGTLSSGLAGRRLSLLRSEANASGSHSPSTGTLVIANNDSFNDIVLNIGETELESAHEIHARKQKLYKLIATVIERINTLKTEEAQVDAEIKASFTELMGKLNVFK